jgi:hypothetical protein
VYVTAWNLGRVYFYHFGGEDRNSMRGKILPQNFVREIPVMIVQEPQHSISNFIKGKSMISRKRFARYSQHLGRASAQI